MYGMVHNRHTQAGDILIHAVLYSCIGQFINNYQQCNTETLELLLLLLWSILKVKIWYKMF